MKSIRVMKSGKLMKEIPWTEKDEAFFRMHEGYMIADGMTLTITDQEDELPSNSFIGLVKYLGKVKMDRRVGEIRWACVKVLESSVSSIIVNAELWLKVPVDKVDIYFTAGFPHKYLVLNSGSPSQQWIHHFGNIVPVADGPTTTVTVASDG